MGFFGLFKGAPKDEKNMESDTFRNLSNVFGTQYTQGSNLQNKGQANQNEATNFFKGVAKGDRTAIAPAVNAAVEGGDAAKREQAQMGTSRGGGANAGNQQLEAHTQALISSLLGQAQEGAAGELANIGGQQTGMGIGEIGQGAGTETNVSSLLHQDVAAKNASAAKMWGSLVSGGLNLATAGLSGGFKGLLKPGGASNGAGANDLAGTSGGYA